jgi:ATP-binding cassette subfamily F protein uup
VAQKEENKAEKKDWKQNNPTGNLTLTSKRISKNRKEIKDFSSKNAIEQLFTDEKYRIRYFKKSKRTRKHQ